MDLKYALRSLLKNPGFTALAVIVMALGIGANTAVFSVVNAVLLRPLAYKNPERIVTLSPLWTKTGRSGGTSSAPDFHDWHDQSTAFDAMAYYMEGQAPVGLGSTAEYGHVSPVSREFFDVFQAAPVIGRGFAEEDWKDGRAALISYAFWQSHFGGNADTLGKPMHMFDHSYQVVGVMPAGFRFPGESDIWIAAGTLFPETESRSAHNYRVVGRLKEGISIQQAQAQMTPIGERLEHQYPDSNQNKSVAVTGMRDRLVRDVRTTLYLLLGAVGVVLLISCANMANLLLARATSRTREIAIRAAVGAGRGRIVRQLITESVVLALVAGVLGLLLAIWGAQTLVAIAPANIPRLNEGGIIDKWVLAFTFGISLAASLLFGLAPALTASRIDLNDALKLGAARSVIGGGAGRLRSALVVAEIALSVVLLAGAGLLARSFIALNNVAMGFRPEKLLLMETFVPAEGLEASKKASQFYKGLVEEIRQLPSVASAGATLGLPGDPRSNGGYWVDQLPSHPGVSAPQAVFSVVTPGLIGTLGIPVKIGRDFNDGDTYDAPFTAMINEALAKKSFPGQDPIGRMILCGLDSPKPMRIVGVVGDVRQMGPASEPWPEIIMPYEQHPYYSRALFVTMRTSGDTTALSEVLRRKVRERSPDVPVKFTTMEASLAENVAAPRFRTLLFLVFAGLAVCLAMAGVYGVMAYVVGQRLNEIGLRMALGASQGDVLGMVLKQALTLAGAGVVLGLAGAVAATRLLTSFLFEVKAGDPITYLGVAVLLSVVAMAASYLPARRATKVDPLAALRQE
ncbi:MAG TPA: ABC transporter permease [Bryobacteraceae bacterium]|jgi:putative ABC transport system permease protein|nr:ABC transporter permease [Bryobacteraceae bacterium]